MHDVLRSLTAALALLALPCDIARADTPPAPAVAPPAAAAPDAAALRSDGMTMFKRNRWSEAYLRFEAAEKLEHSPVIVLYMARCRREMGDLLGARPLFGGVANEAVPPDAPEIWGYATAEAAEELRRLDRDIPTVRLALTGRGAERARLSFDGAPAGNAVIEANPGRHRVEARIGGRLAGGEDVLLVRGEKNRPISLHLPDSPKGPLAPGIAAVSLGAAWLVVGATAGIIAVLRQSEIRAHCEFGGVCLADDKIKADAARTLAHVSTTGFVVGGVFAAAGIGLCIARPRFSAATTAWTITTDAAPAYAGLSFRGDF